MLKEVEDAMGRMEEPVTFNPPARMVSPPETRRPADEASPAEERPPVKVEVAAPETVSVLVMTALPSLAWPVTSSPPAKVEVPRPATVRRLPTENEVVEARGNDEARLVEVAKKADAVGVVVAAMFDNDVQ